MTSLHNAWHATCARACTGEFRRPTYRAFGSGLLTPVVVALSWRAGQILKCHAAMSKSDAKRIDEDEISRAFLACPKLPVERARSLAPDIMMAMEPLADALCVQWTSVLLGALVGVASLAPEDGLEIAPSVKVRSVVWSCLLHPGSTNSSGVVGCVADAIGKICKRDWVERKAAASRAQGGAAVEPHYRDILAGGGSLAGTGVQMSKEANRGAALLAEPELDCVLQWFTNETSVDASAPAKLWDGRVWARPVLDKMRAFLIPSPWFSIFSAGHVPELCKATLTDKLGLRQRLTVDFPEPRWLTIAEIRTACEKLPVPGHGPDDYLAALLYPALKNSVACGGRMYTADTEDGASKLIDDKFDSHMSLQKDNWLKAGKQDLSRKHGKLRTKFDRLLIAVHLLQTYCKAFKTAKAAADFVMQGSWGQDVTPAKTISKAEVEFTYLICTHFEATWDLLDFARPGHKAPPLLADADGTQVADDLMAEDDPQTRLDELLVSLKGRCWQDDDLDFFVGLDVVVVMEALETPKYKAAGITSDVLLAVMKYIFASSQRWFQYKSSSAVSRALKRLVPPAVQDSGLVMYIACLASKMLEGVGLGALARTIKVAGGGQPNWWFVGKSVEPGSHALLNALGIHEHSTPSLDVLTQRFAGALVKPPRAPDVVWPAVVEPSKAELLLFFSLLQPSAPVPAEAAFARPGVDGLAEGAAAPGEESGEHAPAPLHADLGEDPALSPVLALPADAFGA